jgi:hypothetical protein
VLADGTVDWYGTSAAQTRDAGKAYKQKLADEAVARAADEAASIQLIPTTPEGAEVFDPCL